MKFLVERHRLRRVVLVTHEDCAWHDDERMFPALLHRLAAGASGADSPRERRLGDLRRMTRALHELLPPLAVEAYFAEKQADGKVGVVRVA